MYSIYCVWKHCYTNKFSTIVILSIGRIFYYPDTCNIFIHFFPGLQLVLKSHAPCGKRETMRKWKQFFPKMYAGQMPQVNGDVVWLYISPSWYTIDIFKHDTQNIHYGLSNNVMYTSHIYILSQKDSISKIFFLCALTLYDMIRISKHIFQIKIVCMEMYWDSGTRNFWNRRHAVFRVSNASELIPWAFIIVNLEFPYLFV